MKSKSSPPMIYLRATKTVSTRTNRLRQIRYGVGSAPLNNYPKRIIGTNFNSNAINIPANEYDRSPDGQYPSSPSERFAYRNKSLGNVLSLKQDVHYSRWFIIKVIIGKYVYTHYKVVTKATHRVMRRHTISFSENKNVLPSYIHLFSTSFLVRSNSKSNPKKKIHSTILITSYYISSILLMRPIKKTG